MSQTVVFTKSHKESLLRKLAATEFMSLKVNLKAWGVQEIDARFSIPNSLQAISTQKLLATSRFGDLYTAVVHNSTVEPFEGAPPTHLVKIFFRRPRETDKEMVDRAKREFALTRFINYRAVNDPSKYGLADPCFDAALCGELFLQRKNDVAIAFPFSNAIDLRSFLDNHFYPSFSPATRAAYQREALSIARLLLKAIERLNAFGICHGNIDPLNILVSYTHAPDQAVPHVSIVRMIDFDFACMEIEPELQALFNGAGLLDLRLNDLACPLLTESYSPGARFRDPDADTPASTYLQPGMSADVRKRIVATRWHKYERYAAANVIQLLFDPEQVKRSTIEIRQTLRTPPALVALLREMVGPIDARPEYGTVIIRVDTIRGFVV